MLPRLSRYARIVGKEEVRALKREAEPFRDMHITHINSTPFGGGVSEILNSMIILFNELGVETGWRLFKGTHTFFNITKKFHNALQGERTPLPQNERKIYLEEIEKNSIMNHLGKHDLIIVHDPQPLAMIRHYPRNQPWLWRCHIDVSHPSSEIWRFLLPYINQYDGIIVSMEAYKKEEVRIPHFVRAPSIDPLSLKNRDLSRAQCRRILSGNGIDLDRPIICQVSRFDKWKDPLGVVDMYEEVRKKADCQLVMIGDMATDDPEGPVIYNELMKRVSSCKHSRDMHISTQRDDLLVNALQRTSQVVVQNSIREGFGLTVTEALYKETPVVATNRGGIPLQVIDSLTGFLIEGRKEGIRRIHQLLEDHDLRERLGRAGRDHVISNFLITGHIHDYLRIMGNFLKARA